MQRAACCSMRPHDVGLLIFDTNLDAARVLQKRGGPGRTLTLRWLTRSQPASRENPPPRGAAEAGR
jgi:hypothetical protein